MDWVSAIALAAVATAIAAMSTLAARVLFVAHATGDEGAAAPAPLPADIYWCPLCKSTSLAQQCSSCGSARQLLINDLLLGAHCGLAIESVSGRYWGLHTYQGYAPVADRLLLALGGGFPFEEIAGRVLLDEEARS